MGKETREVRLHSPEGEWCDVNSEDQQCRCCVSYGGEFGSHSKHKRKPQRALSKVVTGSAFVLV